MKTMKQFSMFVTGLAFFFCLCSLGLAGPCENLKKLKLPDTAITSATSVSPPFTSPPSSLGQATVLVPFCRVEAVVTPSVKFEVWMPPPGSWNQRFEGVGNGAFAGGINYPSMNVALTTGFGTASTDTGHVSGVFDASWALGHPELIEDWAVRSAHVMTVAAKAIVTAYYGEYPLYSYFSGCSGGGRQALREAQDFSDDYDGILVGAPARFETHMIPGMLWNATVTLKDPDSYIPASKLPLIANAVIAHCDGLDGIVDGLINDPRRCDFHPKTLQCQGPDAPTCLTAPQVKALQEIYKGARTCWGEQIYPGFMPGGELGPGGWASWITGPAPGSSFDFLVGDSFFKYMVFENPSWDWRTFHFDGDVAFTDAKLGYINGDNPDLRSFKARGGKMVMYHGWSDPAISPLDTIDYYHSVVAFMDHHKRHHPAAGGPLHETQEFFRLFLMPGVQHCSGGPGPDRFDGIGVLRQWVEHRIAPDKIIASHYTGNAVDRTRPLCPYPEVARWTGKGSTDDAANFVCVRKGLNGDDEDRDFDHGRDWWDDDR